MKRIISFLVALFCLSLSVSALAPVRTAQTEMAEENYPKTAPVSFNENYTELEFGGQKYYSVNSDDIYIDREYDVYVEGALTLEQIETLDSVYLNIIDNGFIIFADIDFVSGMGLDAVYLNRDYMEKYNEIKLHGWEKAVIPFGYPEGNEVFANSSELKGKTENIFISQITIKDSFDVYAISDDGRLKIRKGLLLMCTDRNYYVDFTDADISLKNTNIYQMGNVLAYEITNEGLNSALNEALDKNYRSDYGFFNDDEFTTKVSDGFCIVVFGVLPLCVLVLFLVLGLRSKTKYKRFHLSIATTTALELIIFAVTVLLLNKI